MTPEQKIEYIERQIVACKRGDQQMIMCPYCHTMNVPDGDKICCITFGNAAMAILQRMALDDLEAYVDMVSEKADKENKWIQ